MADFKRLKVWQFAHTLALETYKAASEIRGAHHMALRSQLIRASGSVPANIVEGRSKKSDKDFARFLDYALGSASELEYHLLLARDIEVIKRDRVHALLSLLVKVRKMLNGLHARLTQGGPSPSPKKKRMASDANPATDNAQSR